MRLKQRTGDFRVRELLDEGYLKERGEFRVYRVTKRKLTTPEAVHILAAEAGVEVGDVEVAGFKDRQAITIQHMSVPRGRAVRLQERATHWASATTARSIANLRGQTTY